MTGVQIIAPRRSHHVHPQAYAEMERRRRNRSAELDKCRKDRVYWCNNYVYTYDPRRVDQGLDPNVPFILYNFQIDVFEYWQEGIDKRLHRLIDKSRDMGLSWLTMTFDLHHWLFTDGYKAGITSYKEDKIDNIGDMDSLFEKGRHVLRRLPPWMRPSGFRVGGEYDNFKRLVNPQNGSAIVGEVGKNVGRAGRNTRYTADEFAFFEHAKGVDTALSQNTNCISFISTPNGMGNEFAKKRFGKKIKHKTLHWRLHPLKDDAWYADQEANLSETALAQEVDISYSASIAGVLIDPKWVQAAIEFEIEGLTDGVKEGGLDVGESIDLTVYMDRHGSKVINIQAWTGMNPVQSATHLLPFANAGEIEVLKYDDIGIGSGVKGAYIAAEAEGTEIPFDTVGVSWGLPADKGKLRDSPKKKNKDRFKNLRIQFAYMLRLRFQATYEHVKGIKEHDPADMISIPNNQNLIAECSIPLLKYATDGRMILESKKEMKARGIESPNYFDALCYTFGTRPRKGRAGGAALVPGTIIR